MIEVKLILDDLNYEQIVEQMLPMVIDKLKERPQNAKLDALLKMATKLPINTVVKMMSAMPQDAKDSLVVMLIDKKQDSIIHAAEKYADSKGITIHIKEVDVEKK